MLAQQRLVGYDLLNVAAAALRESAGIVMQVPERENDTPGGAATQSDAVVRINGRTFVADVKRSVDRVDALRNVQFKLRKMAEARTDFGFDTLLVTSRTMMSIDPKDLRILEHVEQACAQISVEWMLVGAFARDVHLVEIAGAAPSRATPAIDIAVAVET